ncbi:MAG: class I SAM-dependent rRNA methyltransferase [Gammaproteobacteria bacterium]|nr:class I SAM-dependent rRNA methyltransferase [Gammaproteobacteria bacterium]
MSDQHQDRLRPLRLKRREGRRLRAGHLWVFSNEIDTDSTPLRLFEPGDAVAIRAADGRFIASGYVNPHSLIAARILSRDQKIVPGKSLLIHRLKIALSLRERIFDHPCYRLAFGEGDLLPGLVVDRHGDVLVAQLTTAGMERMKDDVLEALRKVLRPAGVLWKNDSPVRELEGLERYVEPAWGEVPETVEIREGRARFEVPLAGGQKTGFYYDQRLNRERLRPYVRDADVLDVFSYVGAFGVHCMKHGAASVTCVDSSATALEYAKKNARTNRVRIDTLKGDAVDVLAGLRRERCKFDVVILDPPAYIKRKKDIDAGREAYRRIIQAGMQLIGREGYVLVCSCSAHMAEDELLRLVQHSARHLDRHAQLIEAGGQGPDHPVHPAIPETRYLKALLCRITRQR